MMRFEEVWTPNPGPQAEFLSSTVEEILFGGAVGGGKALTAEHEVLTDAGWVGISTMRAGDRVLAWDQAKEHDFGRMIYATVRGVYEQDNNTHMLEHENHPYFVASPDHRWVVTYTDDAQTSRATKRKRRWKVVRSTDLGGSIKIPGAGLPAELSRAEFSDAEMELWGWYIAEGCAASSHRSLFSQVKREGKDALRALFAAGGFAFREHTRDFTVSWVPPLPCGTNCYTKFIPRRLLEQRNLSKLIDGLIAGDGWRRREGWELYTASKQLADDVQEAALLLGLRSAIYPKKTKYQPTLFKPKNGKGAVKLAQNWRVNSYPRDTWTLTGNKLKWKPYSGKTYCLWVPGPGTFVARYKGTAFVTGNTAALLIDPLSQLKIEIDRFRRGEIKYSAMWAFHFRRTTPRLSQTIAKSHQLYRPLGGHYNEVSHTWTFPEAGDARIQFAHLEGTNDHLNYGSFEICSARGTRIVMGDGSLRNIEAVAVGNRVRTLEGQRRVVAAFDTGVKPCVEAVVRDRAGFVGRQQFLTTHPVLLAPSDESLPISSAGRHHIELRERPGGYVWHDYESLLCGRPESPVRRVSQVTKGSGCGGFDDSPQAPWPLRVLSVPVVLHEPTVLKALASRQIPTRSGGHRGAPSPCRETPPAFWPPPASIPVERMPAVQVFAPSPRSNAGSVFCGVEGVLRRSGTTTNLWARCSAVDDLRGGRLPLVSAGAPVWLPRSSGAASFDHSVEHLGDGVGTRRCTPCTALGYPHFYSGEARPLTEGVRRGIATLSFCGWLPTHDLTVEGANHYISEAGLVNAQTHLAFDELTEFLEEQYLFMLTRLRTPDPVLQKMLAVRSGTNPVGPGRDWVRKRFVDPAPEGRKILRSVVTLQSGEKVSKDRMFIPSRLSDNPWIPKEYEATIADRAPHVRKALLEGDWYVDTDSFFGEDFLKSVHVIRPFQIPVSWPRYRSGDYGLTRTSSISWWAVDPDGNIICYRNLSVKRHTAEMLGHRIREAELETGDWDPSFTDSMSRLNGPLDPACWSPNPVGPSVSEVLHSMGIPFYKADHNRKAGWNQCFTRLRARRPSEHLPGLITDDDGKPTKRTLFPMVMWFSTCNPPIKYIPSVPADPHDMDDVDTRAVGDDQADDFRYSCMSRPVSAGADDKPWYDDSVEDELAARRAVGRRSGTMGYGGW